MPPTVSVVVPTHDRATLVADTLDTVFAQTHRPVELVVVDDGSADDTAGVVADWIARHPDDPPAGWSARLVRQANAGAPVARNRGLAETGGPLVQFLDDDDLLHPEKLARQVARLESGGADGAVPAFVWSDVAPFRDTPAWDAPVEWGGPLTPGDDPLAGHVRGCLLNTLNGLYRRDLLDAAGPWDAALPFYQDWEYFGRVLAAARRAGRAGGHVPGTLVLYRRDGRPRVTDRVFTRDGIARLQAITRRVEATLTAEFPDLRPAFGPRHAVQGVFALRADAPAVVRRAADGLLAADPAPAARVRAAAYRTLAALPGPLRRPAAAAAAGGFRRVTRLARGLARRVVRRPLEAPRGGP